MKRLFGKRVLLVFAASLSLTGPATAQTSHYTAKDIPPPAKRAVKVKITEGPTLELFRNNEAIIRWTSTNPGGTDEHFGFVKYGTDPDHLNLTAKSHVRLNRDHPYTVFRVRVDGLQPKSIYYYTVDSMQASGKSDGVKSPVRRFSTP
jgi:hypothetical protein